MAEFMNIRKSKNYQDRNVTCENIKALYRFEQENIVWISDHFLGQSAETRGGALQNIEKMKVFLRFAGDPGFQVGIAADTRIHQSTVSRVIAEVSEKIIEKCNL